MPDIEMRAGEVLRAADTVHHLLLLHAPLPADVDKGASSKAGLKLRRIRRALSEAAEDIREQIEEARVAAMRGHDAEAAFRASTKALLSTPVPLTVPELLTRADWDAIPMQAPHLLSTAGANGEPSTTPHTLRKTEADLDALGPLFDEPDAVA